MAKPRRRKTDEPTEAMELRIVGGRFRGRKLRYQPFRSGDDPVTRPMKHRVREAIFNLVGMGAEGRHAIDLFAGTGALGLEALSRGATRATFIERHVPTSRVIEENIKLLGVEARTTLLVASAFLWGKRELTEEDGAGPQGEDSLWALPWLVFCSPPFAFFVDRQAEMIELITSVMERAPADSVVVVEADERFDFELLPSLGGESYSESNWDVRTYAPAVVGVWRKAPLIEPSPAL